MKLYFYNSKNSEQLGIPKEFIQQYCLKHSNEKDVSVKSEKFCTR